MNEKINKRTALLKLLVVFAVGFSLWTYALQGLEIVAHRYNIDPLWAIVLSRFALLGYLFAFAIWFYFEPNKMYPFRFGNTHASIQMPFIWYGLKDNVLRVSTVFSLLCLTLAGIFFYINQFNITILLAGFTFAMVNSVLEELLWRGLILSRIIHLYGEKFGLILMSLAFGLSHYPLGFSIPACLLFSLGGIYFGGIAIRSNGLLLGTVMHISMNLLFVAVKMIF